MLFRSHPFLVLRSHCLMFVSRSLLFLRKLFAIFLSRSYSQPLCSFIFFLLPYSALRLAFTTSFFNHKILLRAPRWHNSHSHAASSISLFKKPCNKSLTRWPVQYKSSLGQFNKRLILSEVQ